MHFRPFFFPQKVCKQEVAQRWRLQNKTKAYLKVLFPLACRSGLQVTAVATVFYTAELNSLVLHTKK